MGGDKQVERLVQYVYSFLKACYIHNKNVKTIMVMQPRHLAFLVLICIIWGFTFVAGKAGVTEIPPLLFTGLRYLLLSAVLIPFLKIHPGAMKQIAIISVTMGGIHFSLFYGGMALSDNVSAVAILVQTSAPFATLLSVLVLGEKVGIRRVLALTMSFLGVMIIGFDPAIFQSLDGMLLVMMAAFVGSIGTIIMRQMKDIKTFELQSWIAVLSLPPLFLLSLIFEDNHLEILQNASWFAWGGVVYTALGASLVGHAGMFYLLQRYEVSLISTLTLLAPVFGVLFGTLFWGDEISPKFLLGGSIILLGALVIIEREGGKRIFGRGV